ncbi:hypothetical protein GVO57_06130 [Sphingomonas changnyeongensis]|uniref:Uncharacterized protein n=1 Tax=Sphingomonas changnyeongensis TaxID=2698679 RepID=A0A7Z2S5L3_9SPHN|nr:hypothetical protein [Sphingomonas changnyeongensis]QHL90493.1 hypothetical protein GVO57_06130 [Sphingomonas changnyeongensis]
MSRNWVPKRIGGIDVPKPWRRAGRNLARLFNQPFVAALVAPAIVAGATAAVRSPRVRGVCSCAATRARQALHIQTEPKLQ